MNPALRLLLVLFTILSSTTIAGASVQATHAGVVFGKADVREGETHFSASFIAPRTTTLRQAEFGFVDDLGGRPPINWPPNDGFLTSGRSTMVPGARLDRFGGDGGRFLAGEGTPFGARSLPSGAQNSQYSVFEVVRPFEVNAGPAAPWFGQPGRGLQYQPDVPVQNLIDDGFLRVIRREP